MGERNNDVKIWKRLLRLSWLLLISAICFLLSLLLFPTWPDGLHILLATIGSTSLVVFLLGSTVDWWLKQAILKDVFKAAVGYLLPPELKPEMEWVYRQDVIATKHLQKCVITPLGNKLVILQVTINRTLTNVSHHPAEVKPTLSIDEWFHPERHSDIIEFGWETSGGEKYNSEDLEREKTDYGLAIKEREEDKIVLAPKASVNVWIKYEEIKHNRDDHSNTFIYPTNNPFVEVEAFEGMGISVGLTTHKQQSLKQVGHNRYELTGTLLPGQQISTQWWRIEDSNKWLGKNQKGA